MGGHICMFNVAKGKQTFWYLHVDLAYSDFGLRVRCRDFCFGQQSNQEGPTRKVSSTHHLFLVSPTSNLVNCDTTFVSRILPPTIDSLDQCTPSIDRNHAYLWAFAHIRLPLHVGGGRAPG
jgi:hypothetical protein